MHVNTVRKVLFWIIIATLIVGLITALIAGEVSVLSFVCVTIMAIMGLGEAEYFIEDGFDYDDEDDEGFEDEEN